MPQHSSCSAFSPSLCSLWTCCWKPATTNIHSPRRLMPFEPPWRRPHLLCWHFFPGATSMPSSISNSNPPPLFYAKVLVGICALLIVAFECLSDFLLKDKSETYARVSRQYAEAENIRPAKPGEPTSVLMIGNSLLLE